MTAPKHRFIKNLENDDAIKFANYWAQWYRKKSLAPMISYLQSVLKQYDDLEHSIEYKKPYNEKYHQECDTFSKMEMETEEKSYRLLFQYDKAQDEADTREKKTGAGTL